MKTPFGSMQHRYENDVTFRMLVHSLEQMIETLKLTPTEVREAAMFACVRFEARNLVGPIMLSPDGLHIKPSDEGPKCPNCGSLGVATERRPDGDNVCIHCHHKWKRGVADAE